MERKVDMITPNFENLYSQFHIYEKKRIERIFFINSLSLGFIESTTNDCEFVDSTNLIFHKSKIKNCSFEGICQNIIFDNCALEKCQFDKAQLLSISFRGQISIKQTTGLPPTRQLLVLEGLPYSKQR